MKMTSNTKNNSMKRAILWFLGVTLLIWGATRFVEPETWTLLRQMPFSVILALAALQWITTIALVWQWQYLLSQVQGTIGLAACTRIYLTGAFVESVTPSVKIGGETAKFFLLRQHTGLASATIAAVMVVQKLLLLLPFFFVALGVLALQSSWLPFTMGQKGIGVLVLVLGLGGLVFLLRKPVNQGVSNGWNTFRKAASGIPKASLWLTGAVSFWVWLLYPVKLYLLARWGFGLDISLAVAGAAVFAAYLAGLLPLLPGGLGAFEGTLAFVLTASGFSTSEAVLLALGLRLFTFWLPLVWSGVAAMKTTIDGNKHGNLWSRTVS